MSTSIQAIINAANSTKKLGFPNLVKTDLNHAEVTGQLARLSAQFNARNDSSGRRLLGGRCEAKAQLSALGQTINDVVNGLKRENLISIGEISADLLKGILAVEVDYNGGVGLGKTAEPMNVNFDVWEPAFRVHNSRKSSYPEQNFIRCACEYTSRCPYCWHDRCGHRP
jgi:hypothetical protein